MILSYDNLWKILADRQISKSEFRKGVEAVT